MLPLAREKLFHIPHGLAAVATCVCLALAFSTDLEEREQRIAAAQKQPTTVVRTFNNEDGRGDSVAAGEQTVQDASAGRAMRQLLPWFPGLSHGGG